MQKEFHLRLWGLIDKSHTPDGTPIELYRDGDEFSINAGGQLLMSSTLYGSEQALAQVAIAARGERPVKRVLIGGLGCGYTLAAALDALPPDAEVTQVELVPAVVKWNREVLGGLAGQPLNDPRVLVLEADVIEHLRQLPRGQRYDVILLDVDNGPVAFTQDSNNWLYSRAGLACVRRALSARGVVAFWSAGSDAVFSAKLLAAGFDVFEHQVRACTQEARLRHVVWVGVRRRSKHHGSKDSALRTRRRREPDPAPEPE